MRAWKTFLAAAIALLAAMSCASPPRYVNPQHHEPETVSIWVDQRSGLSLEGALAGCALWNEEDVRCVAAPNPLQADVVVVLDAHPCTPGADGAVILAHADSATVIGVRLDCFYGPDTAPATEFNAEEYRLVLAHEIGHELGIWQHVPLKCDEKDHPPKKMPDGRLVCGPAIMNPDIDMDVKALTPADDMAFALRDKHYTVLPKQSDQSVVRGCTYKMNVR